jgi:hypothetical protein
MGSDSSTLKFHLAEGEFQGAFLGGLPKQGVVTLAADQSEILIASGLLVDHIGKLLLRDGQFPPRGNPLGFQESPLDEFGLAGLHGKVGLGKGDLRLARIPILRGQVACVPGQNDVIHFPLTAGAQVDHFGGVNEMVQSLVAGNFASRLRLGDHGGDVAPFAVAQKVLKVPGQPEGHARLSLLGMGFKRCHQGMDEFRFHKTTLAFNPASAITGQKDHSMAKI